MSGLDVGNVRPNEFIGSDIALMLFISFVNQVLELLSLRNDTAMETAITSAICGEGPSASSTSSFAVGLIPSS